MGGDVLRHTANLDLLVSGMCGLFRLGLNCRPPQNVRTAQKGPYVRPKGSDGVAKRERRHSEFSLDALVVVEVDIAVNHGVGFA